jgi:hypothetical protein
MMVEASVSVASSEGPVGEEAVAAFREVAGEIERRVGLSIVACRSSASARPSAAS